MTDEERTNLRIVQSELEQIANNDDEGMLRPEAVVEFAKNPKTALHSRFEWNDGEAAHEYRLHQARQVIRVYVIHEPRVEKEVRVFVSMQEDREAGGGYRRLTQVMSDKERREMLLREALRDLHIFQRKYATLTEFAQLFDIARTIELKANKKMAKAKPALAKAPA
jgi:hypothetical protein